MSEFDKKRKEVGQIMSDLTKMCLGNWNKLVRTKIETIVTIHVHQRDVTQEIYMLAKSRNISDQNDFEWCRNTRIYWKTEENTVKIEITDVEFVYSYEFLGAKERLCITALTDRCYITLA